jgi:hypothetical protein
MPKGSPSIVGEGKRVDGTSHLVRVTRIGRTVVEFVVDAALPTTHSGLKLVVDFGDGEATDGSYVRVAAREPSDRLGPAGTRARAVFTSLAAADLAPIDRLVDAEPARTGAGGLSP